jgi:phosphoesterase RecJ-like protein
MDWTPLVECVRLHQRFLLTTHIRPDGDGLGSMMALEEVLRKDGKDVWLTVASSLPPRYSFLDLEGRIERFDLERQQARRPEVIIVLDTGTWNQLGDFGSFLRTFAGKKLVIDHHQTQDDLGAIRFVDVTAEATGRLTFDVAKALGITLTSRAATALFVAVAMDTGWFRHQNTTPHTFTLASALVAAGARPSEIYDRLYEDNSVPRLRLLGLVLERLKLVLDGKVAYSHIQVADYALTGAIPSDTEDMVNFTRSVQGVEVGVLFMEQPRGGVKISFRSRGRVNVGRIAEKLGGGGHRAASGATILSSLEEARQQALVQLTAEFSHFGSLPNSARGV